MTSPFPYLLTQFGSGESLQNGQQMQALIRALNVFLGTDVDPIEIDDAAVTASDSWAGHLILFNATCVVTVPDDLSAGWSCGWSQQTAGALTFAGTTLHSLSNLVTGGGQWALGGLSRISADDVRLYGQLQ
jgi:hypothetical protein